MLATVLPLLWGLRAGASRQGLEVNHVLLFTFGYILYWIFPVTLGGLSILEAHPALRLWYEFYHAGEGHDSFTIYLLCALLLYSAFVVGSALGARLRLYQRETPVAGLWFDHRLLVPCLLAAGVLAAVHAWLLRDQLFTGYIALQGPDTRARGTVAASSLFLLSLLLIRLARGNGDGLRPPDLVSRSTAPYLIAYLVSVALLLGLGTRLNAVAGVLAVLTYWTVYRFRLKYLSAAVLVVLLLAGAGLVGLLRLRSSISTLGILANLFGEPLFTSFSLFGFLGDERLPLLQFPRFLLGDLMNLVPTVIFPTKADFLVDPVDYGFTVFSPLGALNSFVSFMINFGLLGSLAFLFLLGAGMAVLKRQRAAPARVVYAMLSSALACTCFRDPFSVSLVKNMLEFSVLMPIGVWTTLHVISVAARAGRARPGSPQPV
jgi:hypothetical protein